MRPTDDAELRSASTRLALQFAGIILVLFAIFGAVIYSVVSAGQGEAAKRALADASMVDSVHDAPRDLIVTVVSPQGIQSSPDMPDGLPDEAAIARVRSGEKSETSVIRTANQSYLTETDVRRGKIVQISYGLGEQAEELERLLAALAISGVVSAVAAAVASVFVSRRAMRPLAEALALQRRFVADASHELRTPLTLLSTRAQLLRRHLRNVHTPVDDDVSAGMDEIVDDSNVLSEIVDDLLAAADPRQDAVYEQVDLGSVAGAVARSAQARAAELGVTIQVATSGITAVMGSAASLRRMIVALVDNAIDHANSSIRIDVSRHVHDVLLTVDDDGPGFDADSEKRIFERFASSRPRTTPTEPRHYGLGLALVAEIVSRHRGAVSASNRDSVAGASIRVRLPVDRRSRTGTHA